MKRHLVLAAALSIAASSVVAGQAQKAVKPSEPPAAPAAPPAVPAAPEEKEILFGMSAPFSGASRDYGHQAQLGYEIAFDVANQAGGINGRRLRLVTVDDGYEPVRTAAAVKDLVERRKVLGLVGVYGTAGSAAALPYILERRVLHWAPYSGAPLLRSDPPDRYVFNFRASYAEETGAAVRYLTTVKRIPPKQIAVFMQDDPFGQAGWEGVAKALRRLDADPDKTLRVTYRRGTTDVTDAIQKIKERRRDLRAVVMISVMKPAAEFIRQAKSAGLDLVFTCMSVVSGNDLASELKSEGTQPGAGVIVTQVVPSPTSHATAVLRYREALERFAPGRPADYVSLESYFAGTLLVEGVRRAARNLTTETLVDALETIQYLELGIGTPVSVSPSDHQAVHKIWGTVMDASGSFQPVDLE